MKKFILYILFLFYTKGKTNVCPVNQMREATKLEQYIIILYTWYCDTTTQSSTLLYQYIWFSQILINKIWYSSIWLEGWSAQKCLNGIYTLKWFNIYLNVWRIQLVQAYILTIVIIDFCSSSFFLSYTSSAFDPLWGNSRSWNFVSLHFCAQLEET